MRLLVVSDSHGDFFTLDKAIKSQPTAEIILHLGDGENEIEKIKQIYNDKIIVNVRGNCDLCSTAPKEEELTVNNKKIYMTHGDLYNVKFGIGAIYNKAQEVNADILLFGHTHSALTDFEDGLYIMNPGSLKGYERTYGIIDITDNGIVTNIINV